MISDFIAIEKKAECRDGTLFRLLLPDINSDDDIMTSCGIVQLINDNNFWRICINITGLFVELSEGEEYSRDALIEAVVIQLRILTCLDFSLSDVELHDHLGKYVKRLYE